MKRALLIALAFVVGCGSNDPNGNTQPPPAGGHSCTISNAAGMSCTDYGDSIPASTAQAYCSAARGSFGSNGCSHTNLVGSCQFTAGIYSYTEYYYPPIGQDEAQQLCVTASGKWTAGTIKGGGTSTSCIDSNGKSVATGGSETRTRYKEATPPAGQACLPELQTRTCALGTWSNWSGTYTAVSCTGTAAMSCGGVPTSCGLLASENSCFAQLGCTYNRGGCSSPLGSSYDCSSFTVFGQFACGSVSGCSWFNNTCEGIGFYDLLTQSECSTVNSYGGDCSWQSASCSGSALSCNVFASAGTCANQQGCTWK
jgi:hypothetical protein